MIFQLVKGTCLHQNIQKNHPEDGEAPPLYQRYWSREVLMTPIQLANMMATVANEGYYYTPHIIKR
jgi:membrane peptidoglycan carboxypeptidase